MRPIDADALQDQVQQKKQPTIASERCREGFNDAITRVKSMIHSAPTVDAAPVVRGRWIEMRGPEGELEGWIHTKCGRSTFEASSYCPTCGAKMDWEVDV